MTCYTGHPFMKPGVRCEIQTSFLLCSECSGSLIVFILIHWLT